ncbi:MAG: type II toxin-antitoxin system PemK/MazF family toxin [Candidatus Pacebacteria bacterium]|nr:type II toxin-antitoxin system PemK/MazF family toxin [Candidatus Paceibacterota bacterium]MCF7862885.1 type II toxin-antitoxin system PemK/MazF family toxin [Candidatus Paceibacterota bacterium]
MQKNFGEWNTIKKKIDNKNVILLFLEREVWWSSLGINIGREQNGKGKSFERPVVILKKLSFETFICLPITTKQRLPKYQHELSDGISKHYVLLDQIRVLDAKRLLRKINTINLDEFLNIKKRVKNLI